jgi:hypothetical protein
MYHLAKSQNVSENKIKVDSKIKLDLIKLDLVANGTLTKSSPASDWMRRSWNRFDKIVSAGSYKHKLR